jgi:hypothetical protein
MKGLFSLIVLQKRERGYVEHGKNPKNEPRYLTSVTLIFQKEKGKVARETSPELLNNRIILVFLEVTYYFLLFALSTIQLDRTRTLKLT